MSVKVKLLCGRFGPGENQKRGEVVDVSKEEAARMISAGQAEPVASPKSEKSAKTKLGNETR